MNICENWIVHTLYIGRWSNKSWQSVAVFLASTSQTSRTEKTDLIHPTAVCCLKFPQISTKFVKIELYAHCILDFEATKGVDLLPFFERSMDKVPAQKKWVSLNVFILSKNAVIQLPLKVAQISTKIREYWIVRTLYMDDKATKGVDLLLFFERSMNKVHA